MSRRSPLVARATAVGSPRDAHYVAKRCSSSVEKCQYSPARPARLTTHALQVSMALMGASVPIGSCAARIMLFVGGPCTEGLGKVVNRELTEEIRSHKVRRPQP